MYDCGSNGSWCCDRDLAYKGCCSSNADLLQLGQAKAVTTVALATFSYPSGGTILPSPATSGTQPTSSRSPIAISATLVQSTMISTSAARTAAPSAYPDSSNNTGLKVGAGVGVPLGLALLGAFAYILYLQRQRS